MGSDTGRMSDGIQDQIPAGCRIEYHSDSRWHIGRIRPKYRLELLDGIRVKRPVGCFRQKAADTVNEAEWRLR